MSSDGLTKKKLPFAAYKESSEFQRQVILLLIKQYAARQMKHIAPENFQQFQHGRSWNFQQMKLQSSTVSIGVDLIVKNDVMLIFNFIQEMADKMEQQLVGELFKTMSATAQETGNTFTIPKTGGLGEAFLEMIQQAEAHVDKDGKVSRPNFYPVNAEAFEKVANEIEALGPEFKKRVDALWAEKEKEAIQKEQARLARYD